MGEIWLALDSRGAGGIESHVGELAAGLRAAGAAARVVFLADYGAHPLRDRLQRDGVPWEALPAGGLVALWRRLRAGRPALLHTHGYKANLMGRLAARLAGVPVVASYHAGERPGGKLAVYDLADRWSSCLGGRIAVSRPILARLPWGGTLVPNFVALPGHVSPAGPDVVAFVGRFAPEKGPDLFCDLAAMVPGPAYAAYGGGPLLDRLREAHGGSITFHGPRAGMDDAWPAIGLLAVTSRAEGLPLAVLEAMAHGVPVAALAVGALAEVIADGRNGFLAPAGDLVGLAGRVRAWRAMTADARAALAAAARATVAERFGRDTGVAAIRAVYGTAMRRRR